MTANKILSQSPWQLWRSNNCRLFFTGRSISLIGDWITRIATIWLVYQLTDSAFTVGILEFITLIPRLFISPMAGIFIDRYNRKHIVLTTQILLMIQSAFLAFLAFSGIIKVWHIIILSCFGGIISALNIPTWHAFIGDIFEENGIRTQGISLNSIMFNLARFIGPVFAAFLINKLGISYCFFIDCITYIAVLATILAIRIESRKATIKNTNPWQNLKEGFVYVRNTPSISFVLFSIALISFVALPYKVFLPVMASQIFQGTVDTYGMMMSALGIGALISGIYFYLSIDFISIQEIIKVSPAICGASFIGLSLAHNFWLAEIFLVILGLGLISNVTATNIFLQTTAREDKRGRVMTLFTTAQLVCFLSEI